MSEEKHTGFYHDSVGYWEAIGDDLSPEYPAGTIEVPLKPGRFYEWVGNAWMLDQAAFDARETKTARAKRDGLLVVEVDPLVSNPLRWGELTPEQQQAWRDYRQVLLDVPQQAGFPHDVTWPLKPE